jgi:hypothetical protein
MDAWQKLRRDSILSEDRIRNVNQQLALTSPCFSATDGGPSDTKARSNISSIKLGNRMEFSQTLNRIDTSTGSAYSPKSNEEAKGGGLNLKEVSETMRKTNFLLSFKREDKFLPSITRNITVI